MNIPTILGPEYNPDYQIQFNQSLRYGLSLGVHFEPLTAAQITNITGYESTPILPEGFMMFETDTPRMRIILTPANPGAMTNATLGTIAIV